MPQQAMAKNVSDVSYRRVDVDALDPDQYQDVPEPETAIYGTGLGPDVSAVSQYLQANKNVDALKAVLQNPPVNADKETKAKVAALALKVLTSFKNSEIEHAVKSLNDAQVALLLRFVYKGMEILVDSQTSQQLCAWHSHLFNVGGYGAISQVLTSRSTL